nr:TPA_asm: hypothetical protein HUJ06_027443 [Nelumbo nucifera]
MAKAHHLFILLLLTMLAISVSAQVFVSIDCGSTDSYVDDNGITWSSDDLYIQTGESQTVQTTAAASVSKEMTTLRVFTARKKNCYSFGSANGKRHLVRASFYYGNYDKKSSPPTFDLHLDGNLWATVLTTASSINPIYYEAIYVPKGDTISVCLAQTQPNQFPFISALEVRELGSEMYSHVNSNHALFLRGRTAYGATDIISSPDDLYDRIWVPAKLATGLNNVTNEAIFIATTDAADEPPKAVLQTAATDANASFSIILGTNLPNAQVPTYINWYFSEVSQLDSTQKRSFRVYIDNTPISTPIIPPLESVTEIFIGNITASSNTSVSLVPTSDSTLPPLINAMEVFQISDPLTDGTNSKDVEGLAQLQTQFDVLQGWSSDPCLPATFSWDWVTCSSDDRPRITALNLGSFDLIGFLPDFSSMDALVTIDLHNNSLTGEIPAFLGTFPNLKELNLADNEFSGSIPSSLSKNSKLKLVVSGNKDLCVSGRSCQTSGIDTSTGSSGSSKKSKLPVILGATIPAVVIFWVIVGVLAILHHKRKAAAVAGMTTALDAGSTPQSMWSKPHVDWLKTNIDGAMRDNKASGAIVNGIIMGVMHILLLFPSLVIRLLGWKAWAFFHETQISYSLFLSILYLS